MFQAKKISTRRGPGRAVLASGNRVRGWGGCSRLREGGSGKDREGTGAGCAGLFGLRQEFGLY